MKLTRITLEERYLVKQKKMTVTVESAFLPGENSYLPNGVTDVPREILKGFPHSKKVGNYLVGKTLGEGSFAKVKEGLHVLTGEKVSNC